MRRFPSRAALLTSFIFSVFLLLTLNYHEDGTATTGAASPVLSRSYELEAANARTNIEVVHMDRPENHTDHHGTKEVRDEAVSVRDGDGNNSRHNHPEVTYLEPVPGDRRDESLNAYHQRQSGRTVGRQGDMRSPQYHGQPARSDIIKEENDDEDGSYVRTRPSPIGTATTNSHARNSLQKMNKAWGSHPLPSASEFQAKAGTHWVAFFHDQAVAAVLLTDNGTIHDCIVQEVIRKWEQRKALQYLGKIMPLEPVELPRMVHLSAMCGVLNTLLPATQQAPEPVNVWTHGVSLLQGILPGTMWCGRSDVATSYRQLGPRAALDSCCRTHDHCPTKLLPLTTEYGMTNPSLKTRSHCLCELEFYRCLKAVQSDPLAVTVGLLYFNFLQLECISTVPAVEPPGKGNILAGSYRVPSAGSSDRVPTQSTSRPVPTMLCSRRDSKGGCRRWLPNPQAAATFYIFTPSSLKF